MEEDKLKNVVFILTNSEDGKHTDIVMEKLQKANQNVFRFDSDRFAGGEIVVDFRANDKDCGFVMHSQGQTLDSKNIKSVWYRRPNNFNIQIKDLVQRRYAEDEIASFLNGLWANTKKAFWLSRVSSLEKAKLKVFQLQLALKLGLKIPRTIVTNDPKIVRGFWDSCKHGTVFKAIYREFLDYGEKAFTIPTTFLTEEHIAKLDLVKRIPCLFQEFIDKKYEVRVTVVGREMFSVKINYQENFQTVIDWRDPRFIDKLRYETVKLPEAITKICRIMLNKLDLSFGAFDFVVDKTGEIFFLEINPNGQWHWMESQVGLPISDAIVDVLNSKRR